MLAPWLENGMLMMNKRWKTFQNELADSRKRWRPTARLYGFCVSHLHFECPQYCIQQYRHLQRCSIAESTVLYKMESSDRTDSKTVPEPMVAEEKANQGVWKMCRQAVNQLQKIYANDIEFAETDSDILHLCSRGVWGSYTLWVHI